MVPVRLGHLATKRSGVRLAANLPAEFLDWVAGDRCWCVCGAESANLEGQSGFAGANSGRSEGQRSDKASTDLVVVANLAGV